MTDLDAIRARHVPSQGTAHALHAGCARDGGDWPCDTVRVLKSLDAALERGDRAEDEWTMWKETARRVTESAVVRHADADRLARYLTRKDHLNDCAVWTAEAAWAACDCGLAEALAAHEEATP